MALDPLTAGLGLADTIVSRIWPNAGEAERAKLVAAVELTKAQLEVNKAEAEHSSTFVAGWRPFIGWTCGVAIAYNFLGYPLALWVTSVWFQQISPPPLKVDQMLFELLFGMLGIAGLRTYEKVKGVAAK